MFRVLSKVVVSGFAFGGMMLLSSGAGAAPVSMAMGHLLQNQSVAFAQISTRKNAPQPSKIGAGAQSFVEKMAQRGLDFLADASLDGDAKKAQFRALLQDSFDMDTIGRFSSGRYWRVATPDQRKEYLKLFRQMVIDVYSSRFSDYKGERLVIKGYRAEGDKDTLVASSIVPDSGPEVRVDWRVRYKDGKYKVIDVVVEGVSMSVTQRSDFSSVIQRGGGNFEALLEHLRGQQQKTL